jgi:hypothetical protein
VVTCFLQGSSIVTEVKDIIGNPWLVFLPLTTDYLLSSVTDCLMKVVGEVIDVFVQLRGQNCHGLDTSRATNQCPKQSSRAHKKVVDSERGRLKMLDGQHQGMDQDGQSHTHSPN